MNRLGVVVLAAGQGKRMRSDLPKVLHPLAGRPLLAHVLDTVRHVQPDQIAVVYGHGGQLVRERMGGNSVEWVEQPEQLGTGHAVMLALPALRSCGRVLILYGDVPLIEASTLVRLMEEAADTALGLLTAILPDPSGYGRIVRTPDGRVCRIVEHRDATVPHRRAPGRHRGGTGDRRDQHRNPDRGP